MMIAASPLAYAADVADPAVKAPAWYDWTGFYIGAHAGGEWAHTLGNDTIAFGAADQKLRGGVAGGQIGYNHQFRRAVIGLEFSGSWNDVRGQSSGTLADQNIFLNTGTSSPLACAVASTPNLFTPPAPPTSQSLSCNAHQDWTAQALTRLGYTFGDGRFLPYVAAGAAMTQLHFSALRTSENSAAGPPPVITPVTFASANNRVLVGVVLGGGMQYAFGNGFSVGAEYLFAKYATQDFSGIEILTAPGSPPGVGSGSGNHDLTTQTVQLVVNYKLGE